MHYNHDDGHLYGSSVLREAVADSLPSNIQDKIQTIKVLLDRGFDFETVGDDGHTVLHQAALYGGLPLLELLVDRGAYINLRKKWGDVPLDRAVLGVRLDVPGF